VLQLIYNDEGMWRITTVHAGSAALELTVGTDVDDDYSDQAILTGDVQWVAFETELDLALARAGFRRNARFAVCVIG